MPSKEETRKAWIDFIKSKKGSLLKPKKNIFICKQYFDASSYRMPVLANLDRIYLKSDAIPSILQVESCNISNSSSTQYNEEQLMCKLEKRNEVCEKESNLSEIDRRNTKEPQSDYIISNNVQSTCINNDDQENVTSGDKYEQQLHSIMQEISTKKKR